MNKLNKKINIRNIIGTLIFILTFVLLVFLLKENSNKNITKISYNDFLLNVNNGSINAVYLDDKPEINFTFKNDNKMYFTDNPRNPELKEILLKNNIQVLERNQKNGYLINLSLGLLFFTSIFYIVAKKGNKNSKSTNISLDIMALKVDQVSPNDKILFDDIAGNEEAKDSVKDIIDFIKNPEKYSRYGAKMPKGIILYGSPGTGKTLMAKAVAGEAGVPFYAVSGSDFVQMYVGVGASRIRDLFKKAKEHGKAVIFIDEIDALGKKRSSSNITGNDEREQTLNALLTEMSGFNNKEGIVVIAATNRLDILDEALLRPGRFDRQIEISLPDINSRKEILKLYAKDKPISKNVNIEDIAKQTIYFSGAMLSNLLNESAIYAAKSNKKFIEDDDIQKAYYAIIAGEEKKDRSNISSLDKKIVAFHEAGHAVVTKLMLPKNIISRVTIIPSTKGAGGFCVSIPEDKMLQSKQDLKAQIMVSLGGRVAEEIIFGEDNITTGASNDIEKASNIVKDYIIKYGMGRGVKIYDDKNNYLEECNILLNDLYKDTKNLLNNNLNYLNSIANSLINKESLNEEEINQIFI